MNFKKPSLVEIVCDRIKNHIADKELRPGDKLPSERDLIDSLMVSRAVVREALKSLQMMGIVDIKSGGGIYVGEFSMSTIFEQIAYLWKIGGRKMKELLDTRQVLELGAIDLVIARDDPNKFEELERWNQALYDKIRRNEKAQREDLQFHHALFQATGNETYCQLSQVVHEFFNRGQLDKSTIENYDTVFEQHNLIIQYMKQKDALRAKQCMILHLQPLYGYLK